MLADGYEAGEEGSEMMNLCPRNVEEMREMFYQGEYDAPHRVKFLERCNSVTITIDATHYGGSLAEMKITVNKVKDVEDKDRPAFVYFHGGAFVLGDAKRTQPEACFHAVNFGCTSFGVEYGVAPEVKAPDGGINCYAAVKYISQHAANFNIDPAKIAIGGESAGGTHTTMCMYQLAKRNEGHLVKFAWDDIGPSSPHWFERTEENSYSWLEFRLAAGQFGPLECLAKHDLDFEKEKAKNPDLTSAQFSRMVAEKFREDPEIFPVLMGDSLARRCPPVFITTREFDIYRRDCELMADLMRRNKRLLMEVRLLILLSFYSSCRCTSTPAPPTCPP